MTDRLFELWIPCPGTWINANEIKGIHWGKVQTFKEEWRHALWVALSQQMMGAPRKTPLPFTRIEMECRFKLGRTRDPANYEPTRKVLIDRLVKVYKWWPDDNPQFISQDEPTIIVDKKHAEGLYLRGFTSS